MPQAVRSSRTRFLVGVVFACVLIITGRLFYIQVIRHDHYKALASSEQLRSLVLPAKRGEIFAMDRGQMVPLVLNQTVYTVFVDPSMIEDAASVVQTIRDVAGGNARDNLEQLVKAPDSRYQIVATGVSRRQAESMKSKRLKGVGFQENVRRAYPEDRLAAQILGFVNYDGVGNYGIEGYLNKQLSGVDGQLKTITDVRDVPLTIGVNNVRKPARDGDNIVLTVDRGIQSYAEQALERGIKKIGAKNGSVIVMDPNTGKVLSMANYPTYNPAEYAKVQDGNIFNNSVISAPYEPASVIKTFTMAAGIDRGVITPQSTYYNNDRIQVDDIVVENVLKGSIGELIMQDVLNNSLNTGTVTVARRLGDGQRINREARDTLYEYFHDRFGLGQSTGIELSNESVGLVISPKEEQGNAVRYSNMTFGQGLNVTMLQVASGFSTAINGGVYFKPTIIQGVVANGKIDEEPLAAGQRKIKASTSQDVATMLRKARQSVSWMKDKPGYTVGGKTGTAETLVDGRYVKSQTVGTYLGYGGQERPEYVIMVRVAAPGRNLEGGLHAEPIFADISNWLLDYLQIPPKGKSAQ